MKVKLIAFCGAKESGKSTSAELFRSLYNGKTSELAFAGHLKSVCSKVFGIELKYFLEPSLKETELEEYAHMSRSKIIEIFQEFNINEFDFDKHIRPHMGIVLDTPRKVLQYVGTEILHPVDSLIHVNYALSKIDKDAVTLITDLRFPQEFDAMKSRSDFLPVYVSNVQAELRASADSHASEQGWKIFKDRCVILDNNKTLSELTDNIKQLIKDYL